MEKVQYHQESKLTVASEKTKQSGTGARLEGIVPKTVKVYYDPVQKTVIFTHPYIRSEAVDALINAGLVKTRQDALVLGRRGQDVLHLF